MQIKHIAFFVCIISTSAHAMSRDIFFSDGTETSVETNSIPVIRSGCLDIFESYFASLHENTRSESAEYKEHAAHHHNGTHGVESDHNKANMKRVNSNSNCTAHGMKQSKSWQALPVATMFVALSLRASMELD